MPSLGTLRPCPEESGDWDTTQNLFIEGDNLEVLKLLQKSYANKVKMIYIDPPYNTGKEFIYPDKFQDNLDTYLRYTGQKGDEGFKVSSNTESSGRYHTNWLNMMYPRLKLVRNLLKDDGAIFISIDVNELTNLTKLCDEVFGEENLTGMISRATGTRMGTGSRGIARELDYIVVYSKNNAYHLRKLPMTSEELAIYDQEDEKGRYLSRSLRRTGGENRREDRPSMYYSVQAPDGTDVYPIAPEGYESRWVCGKDTYDKLLTEGFIEWKQVTKKGQAKWQVYQKHYVQEGLKESSDLWTKEEGNKKATKEVSALFDGTKLFDHPKPIDLTRKILQLGTDSEGEHIVLDFFAGSCTTAHAVLDLNKEDGGNRNFIMVQLPEPCGEKSEALKAGYKTIAEIGKERMHRAAAKIKEENPEYEGDLGFKVFKLDSSNIRAWSPDRNDLEQTLIDHMEHLVEGRSEEDVLYELLLKQGVDLTVPIEEKAITGKTVYSIGYGVLFACLDTAVSREQVEDLAMGIIDWHKELEPASDTQVVFRDSAFANDIAKTNMTAILEQHGIAHVRSL
jgi:adenine-specific DNA-methyltransferase